MSTFLVFKKSLRSRGLSTVSFYCQQPAEVSRSWGSHKSMLLRKVKCYASNKSRLKDVFGKNIFVFGLKEVQEEKDYLFLVSITQWYLSNKRVQEFKNFGKLHDKICILEVLKKKRAIYFFLFLSEFCRGISAVRVP